MQLTKMFPFGTKRAFTFFLWLNVKFIHFYIPPQSVVCFFSLLNSIFAFSVFFFF